MRVFKTLIVALILAAAAGLPAQAAFGELAPYNDTMSMMSIVEGTHPYLSPKPEPEPQAQREQAETRMVKRALPVWPVLAVFAGFWTFVLVGLFGTFGSRPSRS